MHRTTITARLDEVTHSVHGDEEIRWVNRSSAPVDEVYFHLYLNAFKNSRSAFLRSRLGEGRGGDLPASWGELAITRLRVRRADEPAAAARDLVLEAHSPGDPDDQTDLRATLPARCEPGQELVFEATFDARLPSIVERTGFHESFHLVGQWFPKLARLRDDGTWSHFPFVRLSEFDADFGHYDVTLDVPAPYLIGATGERRDEAVANGRRRERYAQADVHDFAWAAWDGFVEQRTTIGDVAVRALHPAGHEPAVARQLDALRLALPCFSRRLGPYPYRTLTVVQPPTGAGEAGGMEYPTLITTGGLWHGTPGVHLGEALAVHEFGHQYFFGLVATDEHRWPFLDEGLNTYVEAQCLREAHGAGSFAALPGLDLDTEATGRWLGLSAGHDLPIAQASGAFPTAGHYARLVYYRTGTLLATLRGAFGAEAVDGAIGRYAREQRFRHPEPADLVATFAAVDPALGEALVEGLERRGWIDVAVVGMHTEAAVTPGGLFDRPGAGRETAVSEAVSGRHAGWAVVARRGTLRLPVEVVLRFADGSERRERWDGQGDWVRYDVEGPSELVGVEGDPDHRLTLDEDW
ncbi:MAG: M1 family peptidase, partial [Myxococcales bacterium]